MFSSLARSNRIGAFCSRNIPRHNNRHGDAKLSMSTSQVDLQRVAGDTVGGSGTTLVPKVRFLSCTSARSSSCLLLSIFAGAQGQRVTHSLQKYTLCVASAAGSSSSISCAHPARAAITRQ